MTIKMSSSQSAGIDNNAIYHELSPKTVLLVRIINVLTLVMVLIAVILCFVQGHKNGSYYLLVCNLIISIVLSSFVNWWYRSGDLGSEKYWFVILVSAVIIFQCISTDIFVFQEDYQPLTTTVTTPAMNTSTAEWTSMLPPSSKNPIFANIAVILCFVQGHKNGSYYLLVCNLIISIVLSSFVNWWYRSGDLGSEKYWFVILVSAVIIFQCISTDIFVFQEDYQPLTTTVTTPAMNTSTAEWTSMLPPSSKNPIFANIAVILCFVQGHKNGSYYLLVCNLIISIVLSSFVNWWYRSGDLGSEKYWFVILVSAVIIFQCISTDIFVFQEDYQPLTTTVTTPAMNTSTAEWTSMLPPSSKNPIFANVN